MDWYWSQNDSGEGLEAFSSQKLDNFATQGVQ